MRDLTENELLKLLANVFPETKNSDRMTIMVDFPRSEQQDNPAWAQRRQIAFDWYTLLTKARDKSRLSHIELVGYEQVGTNNGDLPPNVYKFKRHPITLAELFSFGTKIELDELFASNQLFIALTEYSATAPLKNAARHYAFRAATMPGFGKEMIPALRIDYNKVNARCELLKEKLDRAISAEIQFRVEDKFSYHLSVDLRYREAHVSSGRFPAAGMAGNLPSGETFIVPYEGEKNEESDTHGVLPVQLDQEIVLYTIVKNRARRVEGKGIRAEEEQNYLSHEPAYGNIAELGFGVLQDFDLQPIGKVLLDEKLGFHIALGRSDHFRGFVGPQHFSKPQAAVHIDRIYIDSFQPKVRVVSVVFQYPDREEEMIIKDNKYTIF